MLGSRSLRGLSQTSRLHPSHALGAANSPDLQTRGQGWEGWQLARKGHQGFCGAL